MLCYKYGIIFFAFINNMILFMENIMANPLSEKFNSSTIYLVNMKNGNKLRSNSLSILQDSKLLNILGYKPNSKNPSNETKFNYTLINQSINNTQRDPKVHRVKYNAEKSSFDSKNLNFNITNVTMTIYNTSLNLLDDPIYCEWIMKTINHSYYQQSNVHSTINYFIEVPICQPYVYKFETSKYSFLAIMGMTLAVTIVFISIGSALIFYHHYRHKMIYGKLVRQSFDELTTPGNGVRRSQNQIKPRSPSSYDEISLDNDNFLNSLESASFPHYYTGAAPVITVHGGKGTKF